MWIPNLHLHRMVFFLIRCVFCSSSYFFFLLLLLPPSASSSTSVFPYRDIDTNVCFLIGGSNFPQQLSKFLNSKKNGICDCQIVRCQVLPTTTTVKPQIYRGNPRRWQRKSCGKLHMHHSCWNSSGICRSAKASGLDVILGGRFCRTVSVFCGVMWWSFFCRMGET